MRRHQSRPRVGSGRGKRFVIIASQFHATISEALVQGAHTVLRRAGASEVQVLWAPGAFELSVIVAHVAKRRPRPDAIIVLGALIRGETPQYEVIAHAVAQTLSQLAVTTGIPMAFGLIVATTLAQARARAGGAVGNRGAEAASAALAVLHTLDPR